MSAKLTAAELRNLTILGKVDHNGMVGYGPGLGINRACLRSLAAKRLALEGPYDMDNPKTRWARITDAGRAALAEASI